MDAVATIKVRLPPTEDAKIPFSQPWLDGLERRLARFFYNKDGATAEQIMQIVITTAPTTTTTLSAARTTLATNNVMTTSSSSYT